MESFMEKRYVQDLSSRENLIRCQILSEREDGKLEKQLEIANNLIKTTNMSLKKISSCTGLSLEELKTIKNKTLA